MLEIACFNAPSAITASHSGADRIELCTNYQAGGLTPSLPTLHQIRNATPPLLPINVMIRPRAGDFIYSPAEFALMKADIQRFKAASASGFVFGILDAQHRVDEVRNAELVRLAAPLPCTFHRAFDLVGDVRGAAEAVVRCGFVGVLTSGGVGDAVGGVERVAELERGFGGRFEVVVGGGVRAGNVGGLKAGTGCRWFHSAAITLGGEEVDGGEVRELRRVLDGVREL